jgi:hypothetical protein
MSSDDLHRSASVRRTALVPLVAGALLLAGVAAADAATSTASLTVCLKRGAPMVAPSASGACPTGYAATRVVGARGPAGATGPAGAPGARGAAGADGARGPQGLAGPQGEQGPEGSQGAQGLPGDDGAEGARGPQGLQGPAGDPGEQGPPGAAGSAGAPGETGAAGPQGPEGPEGPAGPAGETGAAGPQGPAGADGTGPAWLDIGEPTVYTASDTHTLATVTLPAGTYLLSAQVYVTNGASSNSVSFLTCTYEAALPNAVLSAQPPVIKEPESNLRDDVVTLTTAALSVESAEAPISVRCASTNYGNGMTMTATLLATRVSALTVT